MVNGKMVILHMHEECSQAKAKAQLELKLARKVKISSFSMYIGGRKAKDSMDPLLSGLRDLVTSYTEKDAFCSLYFKCNTSP